MSTTPPPKPVDEQIVAQHNELVTKLGGREVPLPGAVPVWMASGKEADVFLFTGTDLGRQQHDLLDVPQAEQKSS